MTNQQIPQRRISQPTAVCWKPLSRRLEPSHKEFEDFLPGCTGFSCFPRMVSGQQDLYYMMYMFCTWSFSRCLWSFMLFNNYWVGGVPKSWNFKMRKSRLSGNCLANAAQQKTHQKKKRSSHDGHCSSELLSTLCWGGSFKNDSSRVKTHNFTTTCGHRMEMSSVSSASLSSKMHYSMKCSKWTSPKHN